jgi:DNA (cytosine-5)-methyltransferase 1
MFTSESAKRFLTSSTTLKQVSAMATLKAISNKAGRLRGGSPPRFMDLFAGCGGISLSSATAGFELAASAELDHWTAESHSANFAAIGHGKNKQTHFKACDITREDPASILREIGIYGPNR